MIMAMAYQIFLSYKHTEENELTRDFKIAKDLFRQLTDMGYVVFFADSTLLKKGVAKYQEEIDRGLDEASLLILVATNPEFIASPWVKYEWHSYVQDMLNGRKGTNVLTYIDGFGPHELPRALREFQSYRISEGSEPLLKMVVSILPLAEAQEKGNEDFTMLTGNQIGEKEILEELALEGDVYSEDTQVTLAKCLADHAVNPDIYMMLRDNKTGRIIGGIDIEPIDDEFYDRIRRGDFIDMDITTDDILDYTLPYPYSVYFSSIIVHPDYRSSDAFFLMYNKAVEHFINLAKREIYIRRMIADAVTPEGKKLCRIFGMKKIGDSAHGSEIYEVIMIPPQFRLISEKTKELHEIYQAKYEKDPWLFED